MQEVEGKDAIWQALAQAAGPDFRYDYYESADKQDITDGVLYDAGRVTLRHSQPRRRACRPTTGWTTDWRRPARPAEGLHRRAYPLFDRPPYVADLTVGDAAGDRALDLRVIVDHFKSKRGEEAINGAAGGRAGAPRRRAADRAQRRRAGRLQRPAGPPTLAPFADYVNLFRAHLPPR